MGLIRYFYIEHLLLTLIDQANNYTFKLTT